MRDAYIYTYPPIILELNKAFFIRAMDLSLREQFLGPSSAQFRLLPLIEEENDELTIESNQSKKSSLGIKMSYIHIQGRVVH